MASEKITKDKADYKDYGPDPKRHCRRCSMFRTGSCTYVKGTINPMGTCKYFKAA
jgi:hypothetical protein